MCVSRKVPLSQSFSPNPPTLPAPHPCPYSKSLLLPYCARCHTLSLQAAYLVPTVLQATHSGSGSGQGWAVPDGRGLKRGREWGRGCSQCYFELLTEQHRRRVSLLRAVPGQAMRVSVPLTPHPGNALCSSCCFLI